MRIAVFTRRQDREEFSRQVQRGILVAGIREQLDELPKPLWKNADARAERRLLLGY